MTLFTPNGGTYTIAEQQPFDTFEILDVQHDRTHNHVIVTSATGNYYTYYVWGFDNGRVRRYPDRDGFMTATTDVFDLDGDGGLELEVYGNDCEPSCAEGTVTRRVAWLRPRVRRVLPRRLHRPPERLLRPSAVRALTRPRGARRLDTAAGHGSQPGRLTRPDAG